MTLDKVLPATKALSPSAAFEHLALEGAFDQPEWLLPLRRAALARFSERGFPDLHQEDWRFTNLAPLAALPFRPSVYLDRNLGPLDDRENHRIPGLDGNCLVFLDGHFVEELSHVRPAAGVTVTNLARRIAAGAPSLERTWERRKERESDFFVGLNMAFFRDGAWVEVGPGISASPVHLQFIHSGSREGLAVHVRNRIHVSRGSRCTVIETYRSFGGQPGITNTVTEAQLDDDAFLEQVKLQEEGDQTFHLAALEIVAGRSSQHCYHSIATGARLSRTSIHANLGGERVHSDLNGLYLMRGDQLADHHMVIEHASPHGTSHEHFNGVLDEDAKGVFHGRIRVHSGAQKTDAKQTNRNLLLSDTATVNTKPQLEIYADDVKCTHGATVGQLSEDAIFYLRSRGISQDQARRLLVHAFAGEIIDRVQNPPIREHLDRVVREWLDGIRHSTAASHA